MGTELLSAVFTVKAAVCHRRKTFRMQVKGYFPAEHEDQRHNQKRPRIGFPDEKERSKDHGIVPIVDPAGAAAFVFHKPALERAEKENTYHITYHT